MIRINKIIALLLLPLVGIARPPTLFADDEPTAKEKRIKIEPELDPYYSSLDLTASLTSNPIPRLGKKTELEIFRELIKNFHRPRELILEASLNPLPYSATMITENSPSFYQSAKVNNKLNMIHAITAGFEEPWAGSMFLGNVVEFDSGSSLFYRKRASILGKRHGYSGILLSMGNYHIKNDALVPDVWFETEVKLKGEQFTESRTLRWSFRIGSKNHNNSEIADIVYFGIRHDLTNFDNSSPSILKNSGIEYVMDLSQRDLSALRHYLLINKKIPLMKYRFALKLAFGFIITSDNKYSGSLANENHSDINQFQFIVRPNVTF